jgi:enoyl-CoA hydratase/carnithine racemase
MAAHPFREGESLPLGGLHVVLGASHRPMTLTRETLGAIRSALARWEKRKGLRWIALSSAGPRTFLAGADFAELASLEPEEAAEFSRLGQSLMSELRHSRLWLVACIRGACMGGGLDFALSCDYRIASPEARFAHPGPRLGLLTGWGGTWALPRRGGAGVPSLLTGRNLSAREALKMGWIEEVAPDPLERAVRRARASSELDLGSVKRQRRAEGLPIFTALRCARLLERAGCGC